MSEPLIQLPNGDWVLPSRVSAITLAAGREGDGGAAGYSLRVRLDGCGDDDGQPQEIRYQTYDEAREAGDVLASAVNAARAEAVPGGRALLLENERLRSALLDARALLLNGTTVEARHDGFKAIGKVLTEKGAGD